VFAPAGSIAGAVHATGGSVLPPTADRPGLTIAGQSIARDRAITVDITFAPNSIRPVEPQWFIRQEEQSKMSGAWMAGAASLFAVGIGILVMMFARLPKAARPDAGGAFVAPADEGSVPPALAAILLARGQQSAWLALQSAFFRLVRDGYLTVSKRGDGKWNRAFDVSLAAAAPGATDLAAGERWILDTIGRQGHRAGDLRRLMRRLSRQQRAFRRLIMNEAMTRRWIDRDRLTARTGLLATGFVLLLAGLGGAGAVLAMADRFGPFPLAIPAVVFVTGLIYVVVSSAISVLSESGLREAARWRARVAELKTIIKEGVSGRSLRDFERWFPLAIGAGIGGRWLKAFKAPLESGGAEIAWLSAMGSPADAAASLAMIVAVSGASHSGGHGAGGSGGGGAGGGSSSAG
jgi:hypothetical protein